MKINQRRIIVWAILLAGAGVLYAINGSNRVPALEEMLYSAQEATAVLAKRAVKPNESVSEMMRYRTAMAEMLSLESKIESYALDHHYFLPSSLYNLTAGPSTRMPLSSRDPWGNPYVYRSLGADYVLFSIGPDGTPGTPDDIHGRFPHDTLR